MIRKARVGIITFQSAHNYGAMLQCYALQKYLLKRGCDPCIINFMPTYQKPLRSWRIDSYMFAMHHVSEHKNLKGICFGAVLFAKASIKNAINFRLKKRWRAFENFKNKYLYLTEEIGDDRDVNCINVDAVICGSDQIWNPQITEGKLEPLYFALPFGKNILKFTYAVSACELIENISKEDIRASVKGFEVISLREKGIADALKSLVDKEIRVDCDPTFLLDISDYDDISASQSLDEDYIQHPYIMLYLLEETKSRNYANSIIRGIKKIQPDIRVFDVSKFPQKNYENYTFIYDAGPDKFVELIRNATYVVTNSFHGTAFSIIFSKNFYSIIPPTRGERLRNLLESLDLHNRIIDGTVEDIQLDLDNINYELINKKTEKYKEDSRQYLDDIIYKFCHYL